MRCGCAKGMVNQQSTAAVMWQPSLDYIKKEDKIAACFLCGCFVVAIMNIVCLLG